jgi:hypothetical protein
MFALNVLLASSMPLERVKLKIFLTVKYSASQQLKYVSPATPAIICPVSIVLPDLFPIVSITNQAPFAPLALPRFISYRQVMVAATVFLYPLLNTVVMPHRLF